MKASRFFSARPPKRSSSLSIWDFTALLSRPSPTFSHHSPVQANVHHEKGSKARYPPPRKSLPRDGNRATNIRSFWHRLPSLRTSTPFMARSIKSFCNQDGLSSPSVSDPNLLTPFRTAAKSSFAFEEVSTVFVRIPV